VQRRPSDTCFCDRKFPSALTPRDALQRAQNLTLGAYVCMGPLSLLLTTSPCDEARRTTLYVPALPSERGENCLIHFLIIPLSSPSTPTYIPSARQSSHQKRTSSNPRTRWSVSRQQQAWAGSVAGHFRGSGRRRRAGSARKEEAWAAAAVGLATAARAMAVPVLPVLVLAAWAAATATRGKRCVST